MLQTIRAYLQSQKSLCWILCRSPAHPKVSCKRAWEMSQPVEHISYSSWLNFGIKTCALTSHHPVWLSSPFASLRSRAACRRAVLARTEGWDAFCPGTRSECWTQGTKQPDGWLCFVFVYFKMF